MVLSVNRCCGPSSYSCSCGPPRGRGTPLVVRLRWPGIRARQKRSSAADRSFSGRRGPAGPNDGSAAGSGGPRWMDSGSVRRCRWPRCAWPGEARPWRPRWAGWPMAAWAGRQLNMPWICGAPTPRIRSYGPAASCWRPRGAGGGQSGGLRRPGRFDDFRSAPTGTGRPNRSGHR